MLRACALKQREARGGDGTTLLSLLDERFCIAIITLEQWAAIETAYHTCALKPKQ